MRWLNRGVLFGAVGGLVLAGCDSNPGALASASSGSLALSTDDQFLYAADTDNGKLTVIDTRSDTVVASVAVGTRPYRVVVGKDDTVYVGNRGSRSVSVIHKGAWTEAARIPTGVDPTGLAMALDGKTLYIVSATAKDTTDFGTVQAIDTTTLQEKWNMQVPGEPRAIALLPNNKAVVTQYRGGVQGADLVNLDLETQTITSGGSNSSNSVHDAVNFTQNAAGPGSATGFSSFSSRAMTDAVATPDGKRVFVPTVWAREDAIGKEPSAGGYYSAGGPCNVGSVATAGIITADVDGTGAQPKVDDLTDCVSTGTTSETADYPPTAVGVGGTTSAKLGSTSSVGQAVQGPAALAVDPTGEWLYMVNKETSNVAIMPAFRRTARDGENIDYATTGSSIRSLVATNADPNRNNGIDGIALTKDGIKAYVYSQFDHEVIRLAATGRGPDSDVVVASRVSTGLSDTLAPEQVDGRKWFYDAMSTKMSSDLTHVACSTCHLEGRDDGHTWVFPDGHRQTPALVGRMLDQTAPYHWSGQFASFNDFMSHTVQKRMGGDGTTATINANIMSFLVHQPAPENANVGATLTAQQQRGAQVFHSATCDNCHTGAALTNLSERNVGTWNADDNVTGQAFDVPSLLGVARSAPYLHDGRYQTLSERVNDGSTVHGVVAGLSQDDQDALVAYLKTL
jgi:YVTN family beta-propeller protein